MHMHVRAQLDYNIFMDARYAGLNLGMSCDYCNPIGSADILEGDMVEHPEFPDPLTLHAGDAINPALQK